MHQKNKTQKKTPLDELHPLVKLPVAYRAEVIVHARTGAVVINESICISVRSTAGADFRG
jgi:flagellar basal body P-ring protein FlgI